MKKKLLPCLLALMVCLGGCALLPEEEVYTSNVSRPAEDVTATYAMTAVVRGDVTLTERLSVKYASVRHEDLSFKISGMYYDQTFVSRGDFVREGDILMSLDTTDISARMRAAEEKLASLELSLAQTREEMEFYVERDRQRAELTRGEASPDGIRARYAQTIQTLSDQIYVCRIGLEQLKREYETYFIRAPFDGTITYVMKYTEFDASEDGKRAVQISDLENCVFSAMSAFADTMSRDEIYTVSIGTGAYEAKCVTAEELGIARDSSGGKTRVYFQLLTPPLDLAENTSGNVIVTLDKREGVLMVPNAAVIDTERGSAVYVQDEMGLKSLKYVETGLVGDQYTEITGGLEEGEQVIL